MRQAGRYMAEYRALRQRHSLLDLCRSPELATEVTLQPVRAIEVDAAIIFSDLLLPLEPMGLPFDFVRGEGPAIERPLRSAADVARLRDFEPREALGYVFEAIRLVRRELGNRIPLIGFGGAPFTLASYAIEGGASKSYAVTKALMYSDPGTWHALCGKLARVMADYLRAQVEAGAQAIQLFDSWVGHLGVDDYREFVLPHTSRIFEAIADLNVPTIHFGVGTTTLLPAMRQAGGSVIGIDWRVPLDDAWRQIGHDRGIQGNLDPTLLLGPPPRMLAAADDVLDRASRGPGHVFNLGHGILPSTPLEHVQILAQHVHRRTQTHQIGSDDC
jgi:uroporphyrinogen decarboxylase